MKASAIYARVSSERQKQEQTIDSQVAALQEYAQQEGYTVPEEWIFRDEGYSGAALVRPGLERLRDLAAEGQIEVVLVYGPDRLSRRYAYQVLLLEEFARRGVEVIFLKSPRASTPEEELLLQFQGMIAEYERAQITERSRRGKRYRAKCGSVNVLSGAPYGYRYLKKTETLPAYYQIVESEAKVVRNVYRLYTEEEMSIGAITRWLNAEAIPTRKGKSRWERSTVWAMLRNPAYQGRACYGKTEVSERKRVTRPLRQRGGFSARSSANRERPREAWIEIPVPAIITEKVFALSAEKLERNKQFSPRHTKEPTLLQGILVCQECGYAYYRTSTRTSKRKLYYYRCLGSDDYRHLQGRVCSSRPIRQDYLDDLVWQHLLQLLQNPDLIRAEIGRRMQEIRDSSPTKQRKETLLNERTRLQKGIDSLLDAYQEGLVPLEQLRKRIPQLHKRQETANSELKSLELQAADEETLVQLSENIEEFLNRLRQAARSLKVAEQQRILRLVIKEVLIGTDTLTIRHSIPSGEKTGVSKLPSYLLRSGSNHTALRGTRITSQQLPFLDDPSLEEPLDHPENSLVADTVS